MSGPSLEQICAVYKDLFGKERLEPEEVITVRFEKISPTRNEGVLVCQFTAEQLFTIFSKAAE